MNISGTRDRLRAVVLSAAACCLGTAFAYNFPCGTYVITGSLRDYRNKVVGSATAEADLTVQAVATNGTILAESPVRAVESGSTGRNFLLEVPLTAKATSKSAAVGDGVRIMLAQTGTVSAVTSALLPLRSANSFTNLTLQLYETVAYTNASGASGPRVVTIPKAYVDSLSSWLNGKPYDPFADSDGDGASNYFEYMCGTDPFLKGDKLSIREFRHGGDRVALRFEYKGGVVYAVRGSPSLDAAKADWTDMPVATDASKTPDRRQTVIDANASGDPGEATLYMLPTADARSMFYQLEVK